MYPTRHFFNAGLSAAFHLGFRSPAVFCFVPVSFAVHSASAQIHAYCPCRASFPPVIVTLTKTRSGMHAFWISGREIRFHHCAIYSHIPPPANFSFHHFARFFTCSSILKIPACFRMDLLRKCALPLVVYRLLSTSFDSG